MLYCRSCKKNKVFKVLCFFHNLANPFTFKGPVAQSVEHLTFNEVVVCSSHTGLILNAPIV